MKVPPLQPMLHDQVQVSGDVTIHPSAAIAPSVLLQADPGSRIIIAAGVCIGMGCVLHAHQGTLEVCEGASLAAGVLLIGRGQIGSQANIGAATTIFNSDVPPRHVLPSGSLIGSYGRSGSLGASGPTHPGSQIGGSLNQADTLEEQATPQQTLSHPARTVVYGRVYLEQMLGTLLPHRRAFNQSNQEPER
jgi:carbon dioxide concentrating mechanism protein CcmN